MFSGRFWIFLTVLLLLTTDFSAYSSQAFDAHYIALSPDSLSMASDNTVIPDSIASDTVKNGKSKGKIAKKNGLDAPVVYSCDDSIAVALGDSDKIYLWKNAVVTYQNIELKADYIEFDMNSQTVFATGLPDSTGKMQGLPDFKQGSEEFQAQNLHYNFRSKKGFIEGIKTEQEGGFLHAGLTKRLPNGDIDLKKGMYTTCDADHPHFYLALTKAVSIPKDKIVSGPAYIVLEDVPLPIGVPFGFFPNTKKSASGILLPSYGEEVSRGFFLKNGGYYFALNDYADFRLQADIYTKGTWGLNAVSNYKKRYAFNGNFTVRYYINVTSEKDLPDYSKQREFSIQWSHTQDKKANPNRSFNARVNFSSSGFDSKNSYDMESYLTNTKSSSITYTQSWPGSPFNFTTSLNHTQNSNTKAVTFTFPDGSFSMSAIYPFKNVGSPTKDRFWKNIQLTYNSSFKNEINTTDSLLFTHQMFDKMNNGYKHTIPLSFVIKPFNGFNITPSLNYNGYLYTSHIRKYWDPTMEVSGDTVPGGIATDTIHGLTYAQALYPSVSFTLNPKLYGMYNFKKGNVKALRHVISPTASFSYVPDMRKFMPSYYRTVYNEKTKDTVSYSIFAENLWGAPSSNGQSASVSLALRNTLEMKVRHEGDTTDQKVKILENFDFSTSYNPLATQFKWSTIRFNTGTSLLKGLIDIRASSTIDPYKLDSSGTRINAFEIKDFANTFRVGRITSAQLSVGMSFKSASGKQDKSGTQQQRSSNQTEAENNLPPEQQNLSSSDLDNANNQEVNFDIPWTLKVDYSFTYSKPAFKSSIVQTVRLSGDFSLTPKWKIGYNTGYDFVSHKMTVTNVNIYRDLHCWEMRLSFVPFGTRKSYTFLINVKASILKDLKYNKSRSWYDNF